MLAGEVESNEAASQLPSKAVGNGSKDETFAFLRLLMSKL
jgi:hypothetical protein